MENCFKYYEWINCCKNLTAQVEILLKQMEASNNPLVVRLKIKKQKLTAAKQMVSKSAHA